MSESRGQRPTGRHDSRQDQDQPPDVVVGIDMGTTAVKVTAFPVGGGEPLTASREYPLASPEPGWEQQDAQTMLTGMRHALTECAHGLRGARVRAIGLSAAMHGLAGLDADRRPVTPLLTWADSRAAAEARALDASGALSAQRSGTPVHPMAPVAKIRWFVDHEPALVRRVRWWVGLKDLIVLELTGEVVTERSSASGTGMLALRSGRWDAGFVTAAGTDVDHLPPVRATTDQLPLSAAVARATGLPAGIPVVLGAGDGPMGNLGTGALEPGVVGLSIGTSAALRMVVPRPPAHRDRGLFCYPLVDDAWVVGGALSNGGLVARWAGQTLLGHDGTHDEELVRLAASAPAGCDGLVMVPYLVGERSPLWDPTIPGALLGLRREHGPAHLARAAIEGVGLQLAAVLERLESVHPVTEVRATGGVFRAGLWRDIVSACLDRPLAVVDAEAGSGLGAAALALHAIGDAPTPAEARALLVGRGRGPRTRRPPDALVRTYRDQRARVGGMVRQLGAVAAELDPAR